jgi:hypothetical protein
MANLAGMTAIGAIVSVGMLVGASVEQRLHLVDRTLRKLDPAAQAKSLDAAANLSDRHNAHARPVACPPKGRLMVALIVGQSNVGNFAARQLRAGPRVSVFYEGRCWEAADPLLGASGARGSPWPAFADAVVASGRYDHVLLVPAAVGATPMSSWAPGGIHHDRIAARVDQLAEAGLAVTHVLIGQGEYEASANADPVAYRRAAEALIRSLPTANVYFATTGRCESDSNAEIRAAQAAARAATGARPGPDMDRIEDRVNGCHLGARGQMEAARAWARAVLG